MNSISRSKGGLGWVNSYSKVRVTNEIKEISVCQGKKIQQERMINQYNVA